MRQPIKKEGGVVQKFAQRPPLKFRKNKDFSEKGAAKKRRLGADCLAKAAIAIYCQLPVGADTLTGKGVSDTMFPQKCGERAKGGHGKQAELRRERFRKKPPEKGGFLRKIVPERTRSFSIALENGAISFWQSR